MFQIDALSTTKETVGLKGRGNSGQYGQKLHTKIESVNIAILYPVLLAQYRVAVHLERGNHLKS